MASYISDDQKSEIYNENDSSIAQAPQKNLSSLESIQIAHQETRKAIDSSVRDRTLKTYEEAESADSRTILHALKSILNRLERIELLLQVKA